MKIVNLALRFMLELAALVALGYGGYHSASGWVGVLLCIAAPIGFAVLWGLFAAHRAKFPPREPYKALLGAVLLEVTAGVLLLEGQGIWAGVVAVLIGANSTAVYLQKYQ